MDSCSKFLAAFYVRNEFQIQHFKRLYASFENAVWVVGSGKLRRALQRSGFKHVSSTRQIKSQNINILFHQGGVEAFMLDLGCKLAMVQYGYAKAPYNFGLWRGAADLIFTYGHYAATRLSHLAHSLPVGNPRWDDFQDPAFRERATSRYFQQTVNGRPNIVYAPTWGDISSIGEWMPAIINLGTQYNIFIKAHHNTGAQLSSARVDSVYFVPEDDLFELLVIADVLVSDYSGAIFDGLLCEKPVVLLDLSSTSGKAKGKVDAYSPELEYRDFLGVRVSNPLRLSSAVKQALSDSAEILRKRQPLRVEFFDCAPNVCQRIVAASKVICSQGGPAPLQMQSYIRDGVRGLNKKVQRLKLVAQMLVFLLLLSVLALGIAVMS